MKKNSEKKARESSESNKEDLAADLKEDLKESEAEIEKDIKRGKESGIGTTITILIILALLVIVVGFIIKTNFENTIQNNNLTNTLSQINTFTVDINRLGFIPTIIEINKGDSVIWKNQNFSSHKIIFDSGNMDGFEIDKLGNYSITFNDVGVYEYHSVTQIYMKGKINVK